MLVPPDIRRVWVPTHENADGELVAGHWVYLRVRDFRWFLESPGSPGAESGRRAGRRARAAPGARRGRPATGVPWVEVPSTGSSGPARPGSGAAGIGQPSGIAAPSPAPTSAR